MAMEVEYEEYASTSSSKHHGWKLEVSRQHKERREMEALEAGGCEFRIIWMTGEGKGNGGGTGDLNTNEPRVHPHLSPRKVRRRVVTRHDSSAR